VENGIFWSENGSGFVDAGGTPPPKFQGVPPGRDINNKPDSSEVAKKSIASYHVFFIIH